MSNSNSNSASDSVAPDTAGEIVILHPSYWVPLGVATLGVGLALLSVWAGAVVGVFALFLALQATILRLHFTPMAMELYRGGQMIRQFPYCEWLHWQIFWPNLPILFYFREVKSIHFLPILFDPTGLQTCLTRRCPLPLPKPQ
jgi:hypothetical protein